MMDGQLTLYGCFPGAVGQPEWETCFKFCKHFDSHPEYPPDKFLCSDKPRCTYCDHNYGTSGKQFFFKDHGDNIQHMYCRNWEPK